MYKDDYSFSSFMKSAEFWTEKFTDAHRNILDLQYIKAFNKAVTDKLSSLYSLKDEDDILSSEKLIKYIASYEIPSKDMYDSKGNLITKDFYDDILLNRNIKGIKDYTCMKYGLTIKKISIRSFPTEEAVYSNLKDIQLNNFDRFQETGCWPFEPVLILHESLDKLWFFVKTYNYIGWTKACNIAISEDKNQVFKYDSCESFVIVTGKEAALSYEKCSSESKSNLTSDSKIESEIISEFILGMGTKLCLIDCLEVHSSEQFIVKIPARGVEGKLIFKKAYLKKNENISVGYLPYTRFNIINQAFKYLDITYDWGDKYYGKDCSSFILTIFRCFGFYLPRNADQQEKSFIDNSNSIVFDDGDTIKERYKKMDGLLPGAALFMKGHVMLYLGKHMGTHYMVHSFLGYAVKKGSDYESRTALCVGISPVDMYTASGVPFLNKFTSAVQFEFPINHPYLNGHN
jgi:hypothetical protein